LLTPVPALTVLLTFLRSLFVHGRATGTITWATVAEVAAIGAVLYVGIWHLEAVGIVVASAALVVGRSASCLALFLSARSTRRAFGSPSLSAAAPV
ncbi:MAG: hypothetical protein AB1578_07955, partial [Thermodesulfobacteriota bacterium]